MVALLIFSASALPAMAEEEPLIQNLPQIYVVDLSIPQRQMNAGDTVRGTFTLFNNSQTDAPDVFYLTALVGDFKNNVPTVVYDKRDIGKTFLAAGEKKSVSFMYQLPKTVSGNDLGIRIQTIFAGLYMGWRDAKIAILGSPAIASVTRATLLIGGKEFIPETGPAVPKGGTVEYRINFSNPTDKTISFTPHVKVYNRLSTGELLREFSDDTVIVKAKETAEAVINLPTFNDRPLVYAGEITFLDRAGDVAAPAVTFRYLILGDMATIQSLAIDKASLTKGETANVTVFYQPPPFDQFSPTSDRPQVGEVDLTVALYDENDTLIGTASKRINLDGDETSAVLPLTVSAKARTLSATAVISKNGTRLSTYSTELTPPTAVGATTADGGLSAISIVIAIAIVVLLLGVLVLELIKKSRGSPPSSSPPSGENPLAPPPLPPSPPSSVSTPSTVSNLVVALLVGAALAVSWGLAPEVAQARCTFTGGTFTGCSSSTYDLEPDVFVNNPIDRSHLTPDAAFNLEVRQTYQYCSNAIGIGVTTWTIVLDGETKTYISEIPEGDNVINQSYSFPLTAPSEPGTYRIDIKVDNYYFDVHHWTSGYIRIIVDESSLDAPVLDEPTEGPGPGGEGGSDCLDDIKLDWSAVLGAEGYEIYRDGIILAEVTANQLSYTDSAATAGTHSYYVVAVACSSRSDNSNTVNATKCAAEPEIDTTVVPAPNPSYPGGDVTWTATPFGECHGPFSYSWTGDDSLSGTGQTVTHTYESLGSYDATVTVSAPNCLPVTKQSPTPVNVIPRPAPDSLTCSGSPQVIRMGETVTWTAVPNPAGNYTYEWSGDDNLSGDEQVITKVYRTSGLKSATVSLVGLSESSECSSAIRVQGNPNYQEI